MSLLKREMTTLASQAGGSFKTVSDRIRIAEQISQHLQRLNIQIKRVSALKARHIENYIQSRLTQEINKRTLQNEMAALRSILRQAERERLATSERISNKALGIGDASRAGTRQAITDEHYQRVLQAALERDEGMTAGIELARSMGLRSEEMVQSVSSLKTWQKALAQGKERLPVIFGTKTGRPRDTRVLDPERVKCAVNNAIRVAEQRHGKLIDAPTLKAAMKYWHNHAKDIGLKGAFSPHSLRYAWAQDALRYYQQQGMTRKEALALTAMDLGHGDGRGRYVARVYEL